MKLDFSSGKVTLLICPFDLRAGFYKLAAAARDYLNIDVAKRLTNHIVSSQESYVYTFAQASLIASIIKYLIYLYLDEKQRYYISMYNIFVNCDPRWNGFCVNLFKLNIRTLKQNFKMIRNIVNQYRKLQTSKKREAEFKNFEAVIEFLAKAPIKTEIEATFSYA